MTVKLLILRWYSPRIKIHFAQPPRRRNSKEIKSSLFIFIQVRAHSFAQPASCSCTQSFFLCVCIIIILLLRSFVLFLVNRSSRSRRNKNLIGIKYILRSDSIVIFVLPMPASPV